MPALHAPWLPFITLTGLRDMCYWLLGLRPPQHLGYICPLSHPCPFPEDRVEQPDLPLQQAGCLTLSSASSRGCLQARKQAASFDLAFMKQRDLSWAPGREAKTSKIPRVSACSRVTSAACVGHVTATRFPPPDLGFRHFASRQHSQGLPGAGSLAAFSSCPLRCNYPTKSWADFLQTALFLYRKDQKRTLKRSPR